MKQQKKAGTGRELIGVRLTANTEDSVRGFVIVPPTVTPGVYPNEKGKTIMKNNTLILTISPNPTDEDLKEKIILGTKHAHIGSFDVRLYLAGYGDDPEERECSWNENPSAVAILKRWCALGGLTALSIMSPTTKTPFDCPDAAELGMTADFAWAASQGIVPGGTVKSVDFLEALKRSDQYCDEHYIGDDHRSVSPFEK
jgi:hypothetical protein